MKYLFLLMSLIITSPPFAFGQRPEAGTLTAQLPNGWKTTGENPTGYDFFADTNTKYQGKASGSIKAKPTAVKGKFGSLAQTVRADNYRGKRIRLSGYLKTENVEDFSSFWVRVDGFELNPLDFDNMLDRPFIKGTNDWIKHELVVDVPQNAAVILIGVMLGGSTGQIWIDELKLEIVGNEITKTSRKISAEDEAEMAKEWEEYKRTLGKEGLEKRLATIRSRPLAPFNLNFED